MSSPNGSEHGSGDQAHDDSNKKKRFSFKRLSKNLGELILHPHLESPQTTDTEKTEKRQSLKILPEKRISQQLTLSKDETTKLSGEQNAHALSLAQATEEINSLKNKNVDLVYICDERNASKSHVHSQKYVRTIYFRISESTVVEKVHRRLSRLESVVHLVGKHHDHNEDEDNNTEEIFSYFKITEPQSEAKEDIHASFVCEYAGQTDPSEKKVIQCYEISPKVPSSGTTANLTLHYIEENILKTLPDKLEREVQVARAKGAFKIEDLWTSVVLKSLYDPYAVLLLENFVHHVKKRE